MDKQDMFKRSADTIACLELLQQAKPGDVIPWSEFERVTGRKLDHVRSNIESACKILEGDDYRMVFGTVWRVGKKRLENDQIPDAGEKAEQHIRRTANRTIKRLVCTDFEKLADEKKLAHNTRMTTMKLHQRIAHANARKQIQDAVRQTQKELPIGRALKALSISGNGEEGKK